MSKLYIILCLLAVSLISDGPDCAAKSNDNDVIVCCRLEKSEFYINETVRATFWLYSDADDIEYIEQVSPSVLDKGKFDYVTETPDMPRIHKEKIKNKEYTAVPISSHIISIGQPGSYKLSSARYRIGLLYRVYRDAPYRGRFITLEPRSVEIDMRPLSFKVKPLPKVPEDMAFSGAVGVFDVETVIPRGNIIVNEEATALIYVRGSGKLGSEVLPEYHEAFGHGNKLKSFSENTNAFYENGKYMSELELQCQFVPTDINNCEIGVVKFAYFNPETQKYEIAQSEPIKIDVKSSAVKLKPVYI